jgi:phosphoglycolate phosphatase-like HAD superfamily hydrolase
MIGYVHVFARRPWLATLLLVWAWGGQGACAHAQSVDPLPSWNDGAAKSAIVAFVDRVTQEGGSDFVPVEQRIATFDNDGTLWAEQPIYFQIAFAMDRVKALAAQHPEWRSTEPFEAVLDGDLKTLAAIGEKGFLQIMAATHTGITTEEFSSIVAGWLATARHPRFDRPYTELTYQPMLELLAYLRERDFKTFIVSGGGVEFMRVFTERTHGIPPEQVVGSSGVVKFELGADDKPVLLKEPEIEFVDDGPGKPVGINRFIGRRPTMAFGNSDGDLQMLQWTTAGEGPRFGLIVHHTDAVREWAYDRDSHIGRLDQALDLAPAWGWVVVSMKDDWRTIFARTPP